MLLTTDQNPNSRCHFGIASCFPELVCFLKWPAHRFMWSLGRWEPHQARMAGWMFCSLVSGGKLKGHPGVLCFTSGTFTLAIQRLFGELWLTEGKEKLLLKSIWPVPRISGAGRDLIEITISQESSIVRIPGSLAGPGAIIWELWSLIHHIASVSS